MRLSRLTLILFAAAVLVAPSPAAAQSSPDAIAGTLRLVNESRAAHGVAPVSLDARLSLAAQRHSQDMVARRYFDHVSPGGGGLRTRVARTGWMRGRPVWALGEDLAWGTGTLATPEAIVTAWMNSPAHRRILLLRRFRVVGIGIATGTPFSPDGATYTADFGSGAD